MFAPVILVGGTWGRVLDWWRPESDFARQLKAAGLTFPDERDPYTWTTDLDGLGSKDVDWEEAGKALIWYAHLKCPSADRKAPWRPVSVVAHSHGGQVVAYAARHGLVLDRVVTVATPPRASLDPLYDSLRFKCVRWTHIWTNEPWLDGWQRRGQLEWSLAGLSRAIWPVTEMIAAHENVYEPDSTHSGLLDPQLWARRSWARFLKP